MKRPPHMADLTAALVYLLLKEPKHRVVVPCQEFAGRGFALAVEFREDGPNNTKLIVTLAGIEPSGPFDLGDQRRLK